MDQANQSPLRSTSLVAIGQRDIHNHIQCRTSEQRGFRLRQRVPKFYSIYPGGGQILYRLVLHTPIEGV